MIEGDPAAQEPDPSTDEAADADPSGDGQSDEEWIMHPAKMEAVHLSRDAEESAHLAEEPQKEDEP